MKTMREIFERDAAEHVRTRAEETIEDAVRQLTAYVASLPDPGPDHFWDTHLLPDSARPNFVRVEITLTPKGTR